MPLMKQTDKSTEACGIKLVSNVRVTDLGFADDIILFGDEASKMRKLADTVTCSESGL